MVLILGKLYSNSLLVMFNSQTRTVGARNWTQGAKLGRDVGSTGVQGPTWSGTSNTTKYKVSRGESTARVALCSKDVAGVLGDAGRETESWGEVIKLDHEVA